MHVVDRVADGFQILEVLIVDAQGPDLVATVEEIAGVTLERRYRLDAPLGVRGRNSDNAFIERELGWLPSVSLAGGLRPTYGWIAEQIDT